VVWIITVTVSVGTDDGRTVEIAGSVITVGMAVSVTVEIQVGIGVVHVLAATVTIFELGTYTVCTVDGTHEAVATTTYVESELIVAMLLNGTFSIAHVAVTTTGETHVDGIDKVSSVDT